MSSLLEIYNKKKKEINSRLRDFSNLSEDKYYEEFVFCLLTPQSNAKRCWEAVKLIFNESDFCREKIEKILKSKTRFYRRKADYVLVSFDNYNKIKGFLEELNRKKLRNFIAKNVKGFGLKEASHFLRNIGRSDSQIAILDRHILRNLFRLGIINSVVLRGKKDYFFVENVFLRFSQRIGISLDELDLLWWSMENGEIFK